MADTSASSCTKSGPSIKSSEPDSRRIDLAEFKDFEKIGSGSFGVVFRARWRNKMVAVKQVKDAQKDEKRYEREIGQALNLEHKNIVKVYGFAPDREDSVYLVMELAEGSLFNALHGRGEKKPEIPVAKSWGLQCAEGVAYLHSQDIMHRDLKSLNALLFQRRTVLKLCDFGEARDISSVSGTAYMMYYVGTIPYMAPEVLEGKRYTEKCDVYSWAMVMWEILTSKIPFNDYDGAEEIKEAKRSGRTPFRVKGKPGIPDDLDNLIVRCWQHGPSDRPTMSQVVSEMKALQDDMTGYSRFL